MWPGVDKTSPNGVTVYLPETLLISAVAESNTMCRHSSHGLSHASNVFPIFLTEQSWGVFFLTKHQQYNTILFTNQGSPPGVLMSWERPFVWAAGPGAVTGNTRRCKLSPTGEQGSRREEVMNSVNVQKEHNHRGTRVGERWRTDGRGACMERSEIGSIWWCQGYENVALRSNNTNCHLCWGATENREDPILINTLQGEIKGI